MNLHTEPTPDPEVATTLGLGKSARGGRLKRGIVLLIVAALILGGGWMLFFRNGNGETVHYAGEAARRGDLTETVTATGTVEPTNKVEVSSELSGTIRKVSADYNDRVTAGQVLAELDTAKLTAQVQHAEAELAVKKASVAEAEATLTEAKQNYERSKTLTQKKYVSQSSSEAASATYNRAVANVAVAKANVQMAEASLSSDETNLKKAKIVSPIDGIVMSRSVEVGQTVASSLQAPVLFTIAENLASMQLEVNVDEADVGTVKAGQSATFTVETYRDRPFPAKVTMVRVAPVTINGVVTYTAVLSLDNSDLLLRPGMTATADIVVKQVKDALLIPNAALRYAPPAAQSGRRRNGSLLRMLMPRPPRGPTIAKVAEPANGERTIYVLENGQPKRMKVRVGASDGSWTEVLSGPLKAGMTVITGSSSGK